MKIFHSNFIDSCNNFSKPNKHFIETFLDLSGPERRNIIQQSLFNTLNTLDKNNLFSEVKNINKIRQKTYA